MLGREKARGRFAINTLVGLLALGTLFPTLSLAQGVETREYKIPKRPSLVLRVPSAWREEIEKKGGKSPITITLSDPTHPQWIFLVSAVWKPSNPTETFPGPFVQETVKSSKTRALETSAETDVQVQQINGPTASGAYFSVTDKKATPEPDDDYRYMTQGMVSLGVVALTFTLLSDSNDPGLVTQSLEIIKGASLRAK